MLIIKRNQEGKEQFLKFAEQGATVQQNIETNEHHVILNGEKVASLSDKMVAWLKERNIISRSIKQSDAL